MASWAGSVVNQAMGKVIRYVASAVNIETNACDVTQKLLVHVLFRCDEAV